MFPFPSLRRILTDVALFFITTRAHLGPAGKYLSDAGNHAVLHAGSSSCSNCEGGRYSGAGAHNCTSCSVGTYSGGASSSCSKCEAGKAQAYTGQSECTACLRGQYMGTEGAASCLDCVNGTYVADFGATACFDCKAGRQCFARRCLRRLPSATYASYKGYDWLRCMRTARDKPHSGLLELFWSEVSRRASNKKTRDPRILTEYCPFTFEPPQSQHACQDTIFTKGAVRRALPQAQTAVEKVATTSFQFAGEQRLLSLLPSATIIYDCSEANSAANCEGGSDVNGSTHAGTIPKVLCVLCATVAV